MSTLNKQIWISQIMEKFYPEASFLNFAKDMSENVEYDKINLADCGFDPEVLINNTTYPIAVAERTDTPLSIELSLYETENTLVRSPQAVELAYDKLESVIYGHRMALRAMSGNKSAHAYTPTQDTTNTPVLITTGDNNGDGFKRLVPEDILKLKKRYDLLEVPFENRYLVLDPNHVEDLILYDLKAFKDITTSKTDSRTALQVLIFYNTQERQNLTLQLVKSYHLERLPMPILFLVLFLSVPKRL